MDSFKGDVTINQIFICYVIKALCVHVEHVDHHKFSHGTASSMGKMLLPYLSDYKTGFLAL